MRGRYGTVFFDLGTRNVHLFLHLRPFLSWVGNPNSNWDRRLDGESHVAPKSSSEELFTFTALNLHRDFYIAAIECNRSARHVGALAAFRGVRFPEQGPVCCLCFVFTPITFITPNMMNVC